MRARAVWIGGWAGVAALAVGCGRAPSLADGEAPSLSSPRAAMSDAVAAPPRSVSSQAGPDASTASDASPPQAGPDAARATACAPPSLASTEPIDARDSAALARCLELRDAMATGGSRCGAEVEASELSLERLEQAVLALDEATVQNVRAIAARGRTLGRDPRVFALVGDSMTESGAFLRPFAADRLARARIAPEVRARLDVRLADGRALSVLDHFGAGGGAAKRIDSFAAPRAAKIGARASWASHGTNLEGSPMGKLVRELRPGIAFVAFGSNDAAYRIGAPDDVAAELTRELGKLLDGLVERGVVPILSTLPRHGEQPGRPDCDSTGGEASDWRVAVQTNAVSAAVAQLACQRHLPLVDYRFALDGLPGHGLDADGVHPSTHPDGGGVLDVAGLRCGMNVRNYLVLRMLAEVAHAMAADGGAVPRD